MRLVHLVKRFFGSLWPWGPDSTDSAWAEGHLLASEVELWRRMSRADRRHAIDVARRVRVELGEPARPVVAAALLHDVGKIDSDLGTFHRVVATIAAGVAGRETAELWVRGSGITRRIGLYLKHPEIGGDLLEMAGSDSLTVAWARQHHLPPSQWTVDTEVATALDAADND